MALVGNETTYVVGVQSNGRPSGQTFPTTPADIAALADNFGSDANTNLTTAGAGTLTAAAMLGGLITRTGPSGAFTDTSSTAALLYAAAESISGHSFYLTIKNNSAYLQTIAGGTGVVITGMKTVPANGWVKYLVTITSASAATMVAAGYGGFAADQTDPTKVMGFTLSGQSTTKVASFVTQNTSDANYTLPVATDTLAGLGTAQTFTAVQTFTNSYLKLLGSSTGATTFTSDNSGASNYTVHIPAANDTVAVLGTAQTFTALQTFSDLIVQSKTITATTLGNTYGIVSAMTFSATDIVSGNGRGLRGQTVISGTVTGGAYISGVQGKTTISGTINHADARINAGLSQLDASAATLTAGYVDGHWVDMGATAPAAGWAAGYSQVIRATNTTGSNVNAIYYGYGKATYGLDLSDNSSGWIAAAGTGATSWGYASYAAAVGVIKVNLNGATAYIPYKDSNA